MPWCDYVVEAVLDGDNIRVRGPLSLHGVPVRGAAVFDAPAKDFLKVGKITDDAVTKMAEARW